MFDFCHSANEEGLSKALFELKPAITAWKCTFEPEKESYGDLDSAMIPSAKDCQGPSFRTRRMTEAVPTFAIKLLGWAAGMQVKRDIERLRTN